MRLGRIINILAVGSLILSTGCAVLWIRSYFYVDLWSWAALHDDGVWVVQTHRRLWIGRGSVILTMETEGWRDGEHTPFNSRAMASRLRRENPAGTEFWHNTFPLDARMRTLVDSGLTGRFGLEWRRSPEVAAGDTRMGGAMARISLGYVTVPGLMFALWWLRRRYRQYVARVRQQNGCCVTCGYDLRATPDRCPECGNILDAMRHRMGACD